MSIKFNIDRESDITEEKFFKNRREIIAASLSAPFLIGIKDLSAKSESLMFGKDLKYSSNEQTNTLKQISSYNNFYELGTGKRDPMLNSKKLITKDWQLSIDGEVENKVTFNMDDLIKKFPLEERIYRLRCVEAWSMVVPWIGFELNQIIKQVKPTSNAKYVSFESILDRKNLPGQKRDILNWPYREGLTIDEAMNPLAILSVGLYGKILPNQNGSPVRLIVPWKYGFKSIKSITKIEFVESQPPTFWNTLIPQEYGFEANVDPDIPHPRWSQRREKMIGTGEIYATQKYNGYGRWVTDLYE